MFSYEEDFVKCLRPLQKRHNEHFHRQHPITRQFRQILDSQERCSLKEKKQPSNGTHTPPPRARGHADVQLGGV